MGKPIDEVADGYVSIGRLDDVPLGGGKVVKRDGRQLAVFRLDEERVFAIDNRCPHEGYPLVEGTVKDCTLTCDWHNWKFDLASGACLRGGENVRSYPLRVDGREMFVDLADPDPSVEIPRILASFDRAVEEVDVTRIARDTTRLLDFGVDPNDLVVRAAEYGAARAEWGWDHGLTVAAECARASRLYEGPERALPVVQAAASVLDATVRRAVRPQPEPIPVDTFGTLEAARESFREAVEHEEHERSEAIFLGALDGRIGPEEAKRWLFPVATDHFLSYGHRLIYTVRALQFLDIVGWNHARALLPSLVFGIVWGTREDRLPYMRKFQEMLRSIEPELSELFALQRSAPESSTFDGEAFFATVVDGRLERGFEAVHSALRRGVPFERIADELSAAAAERLIRFDSRIDSNPAREEGWLDVTHVLTFANSVRTAFTMFPCAELLRGLFYAARFVHYVRNLDAPEGERFETPEPIGGLLGTESLLGEIESAARALDPVRAVALVRGYLEAGHAPAALGDRLTRFAIADSAAVDIWLAHTIKVTVAGLEEREASSSARRDLPLVAAVRFLASHKSERGVVQAALLAREFVRRGR
jgi:nitrite reductase/ring-hydroxylating ferredoxin subunit